MATPTPAPPLRLTLDGRPFEAPVPLGTTLLQMLRGEAGRNGPRYGCGLGECGACTVLIDGRVARACVIPAHGVVGRSIVTLDGLAQEGIPHPVQQAFIEAQAAQCGYCTNGMVMATVALLERDPDPDEATIRAALSHNLCRCGAHVEILAAVHLAALRMRTAPAQGSAQART
jgi:nicotinate dehydrogenase subunit A